ncbi:hypothetical protein PSYJA_30506 [Pseudomonas syringae pv. japonica str. M301072]|uniref:Uncharacterized protein n=1 Tax=Pseudomonas syringae pv. japonica str. M301072 TaxID=629262 RepID=F3FS61_PSESX|nr:hypothetical protein PSYJA_30506 [Pseudomonas syringae pv. japonica str. M301072]
MPYLQCVGDDFETVIQHATMICMVMILRGWEMLHQGCVALECMNIKRLELLTGERGPLPDVFNQLTPSRSRQQRVGRFWFEKACSSIWTRSETLFFA